jgi:Ca2+-dependent lipid-binding protein
MVTGTTMPASFSSYVSLLHLPVTKTQRSCHQVAFVTRFMTIFRFGWGWLIILLAGCATYYSTSMARVRRRARDDIQRELLQSRLPSEHESAEWLNHFLQRFWVIYEPVLSATVISTVDQLLSANCPPFLDSLRLTDFTLGNKAFRIDQVRTFPKTEEDIVMMDWAVSFTPNDVSDMTPREVAKKVNPKIVLSVRVGRGLATAGMPILLEDLTFSGQMRVRMKLMTNFPHVQLVGLMFLGPPVFDYVLKPIGGEHFGFDIGNVSVTRPVTIYTLT